MLESVARQYRAAIETAVQSLTDETAVKVKILYPSWESLIGKTLTVGEKFYYNGDLYKVLQPHTAQESWKPGVGTESLYARIDESHAGTLQDPIPYSGNMALESGKYYSQNGVVYLCNRDTGIPVYNSLSDLVGLYVNVVS